MTPLVSILIPCRNEEKTITGLLDAILQQKYPVASMEVVISDGFSVDATRQKIKDFQVKHPELAIHLIDNPQKIIPSALNLGIEQAKGKIIIRLDAHSKPNKDYVKLCVHALEEKKGENVGGVWIVKPGASGWIAKSIAKAGSSPIGVGDALYRYAEKPAYVDTVPFGAFYKSIITKIGPFNEKLLTNEDYEFNTRIRKSGGRVWMDPKIKSEYFARSTFQELAIQFYRYGFWKWKMLKGNLQSLRYRQFLPPLFVLNLAIFLMASIFLLIFRWLVLCEIFLYAVILVCASGYEAIKSRDPGLLIGMPIAIAVMHFSWGTGFLMSMMGFRYRNT